MPIYQRETLSTSKPWVDVEDFEFIPLDRLDQTREFIPTHAKEHIVCLGGEVIVESERGRVTLRKRDWVDIPPSGAKVTSTQYTNLTGNSEILWMAGKWPESRYIALFRFYPGRPLEMHYHDNDEYWFVYRGHFSVNYNGEEIDVRPGDLLAIGMGDEHGVLDPPETFEGVGFTPRLEGQKRFGHLHREEHGEPVPMRAS